MRKRMIALALILFLWVCFLSYAEEHKEVNYKAHSFSGTVENFSDRLVSISMNRGNTKVIRSFLMTKDTKLPVSLKKGLKVTVVYTYRNIANGRIKNKRVAKYIYLSQPAVSGKMPADKLPVQAAGYSY